MQSEYVQVGVTALRTPDGGFQPSVPLFIRREDAGKPGSTEGLTLGEELKIDHIAKVFKDNHKKYIEECKRREKERLERKKKLEEERKLAFASKKK